MKKPIIKNYTINSSFGTSSDWSLSKLSKRHVNNLNEIGYRGKLKNKRMTLWEYISEEINPKLKSRQYSLDQIKCDNGDFRESFILTEVISK